MVLKTWRSISLVSLLSVCVQLLMVASTEAGEVRKEYMFPNAFHQFLSQMFSKDRNDCSDSFYPKVQNIKYLNWIVANTLGPRMTGFIPMKRRVPPTNPPPVIKKPEKSKPKYKAKGFVRILPSGVICFGIHKLHRRFPKNPLLRASYIKAINGFITFLNFQGSYPHKIDFVA